MIITGGAAVARGPTALASIFFQPILHVGDSG